jgi:hypothetical protein
MPWLLDVDWHEAEMLLEPGPNSGPAVLSSVAAPSSPGDRLSSFDLILHPVLALFSRADTFRITAALRSPAGAAGRTYPSGGARSGRVRTMC